MVAAVVGFGAVAISGVYGAGATDLTRAEALDDARRWFGVPNRLELALVAVPVFALAALVFGGRQRDLGQLWVDAALIVWLGAGAVVAFVVHPAEARLRTLLAGADIDLTAAAAAGRRLSRGAAVCDVAFVVALGLMIWQPS